MHAAEKLLLPLCCDAVDAGVVTAAHAASMSRATAAKIPRRRVSLEGGIEEDKGGGGDVEEWDCAA